MHSWIIQQEFSLSNRGTQKDVFVIELAGAQRAHVFPRLNFFPNLTVQEKKKCNNKKQSLRESS